MTNRPPMNAPALQRIFKVNYIKISEVMMTDDLNYTLQLRSWFSDRSGMLLMFSIAGFASRQTNQLRPKRPVSETDLLERLIQSHFRVTSWGRCFRINELKQRGDGVATYVLIHGAWRGSWTLKRVRDQLAGAGHQVFTPTLTGLGERAQPERRPGNSY
jgi:hypothetical protein